MHHKYQIVKILLNLLNVVLPKLSPGFSSDFPGQFKSVPNVLYLIAHISKELESISSTGCTKQVPKLKKTISLPLCLCPTR